MAINSEFVESWQEGFAPPERLAIGEFAEKYISLPPSYAIPGQVSLDRSAYLKPIFDALEDTSVRIVAVKAAVQTGKSLIADLFVPYLIANNPANILWITTDEDLAKRYAETRVQPVLLGCEPTKRLMPVNRHWKRATSILFPNHTSLIIAGCNISNLQSLSVRFLILDEAWMYKAGYLEQALQRTTAFPATSKTLVISQAGVEGDDLDLLYKKGTCETWGWKCPGCETTQPLLFNAQRVDGSWHGVIWDKKHKDPASGKYNIHAAARSAKLECSHCRHSFDDTPSNRRKFNNTGSYIAGNTNGDPAIKSFTWNALANIDISLASLVSEYLAAKQEDSQSGYRAPLQNFVQKRLAQNWNPNLQLNLSRAAIGDYDPLKGWNEEAFRFMTVDVQASEFWYVVRAWARSGESRLISCGRLETWEQVREKQLEFGIKDQWVGVDSGYDAHNVYNQCVKHGHEGNVGGKKAWLCWISLKGSDSVDFSHTDARTMTKDRRLYSVPTFANPGLGQQATGRRCILYLWSNPTVKDIFIRHRDGKAAKFLVPKDSAEYTEHANSEGKRKFVDPKTGKVSWRFVRIGSRPNHLLDCECMNITMAAIVGALGNKPDVPAPEPEPKEEGVTL